MKGRARRLTLLLPAVLALAGCGPTAGTRTTAAHDTNRPGLTPTA